MNPRILFVVLDGLADRAWPELGGLTPLEAAETPNLDRLASLGQTGVHHPLGRGRAPSTELAHFVLFGYPEELFPGRAFFEASGAGRPLEPGVVAFQALFSSARREADGSLTLVRHFADVDDDDCAALADSIHPLEHGRLSTEFVCTGDRQGQLLLSPGASTHVTDCDPFVEGRPVAAVLPLDSAKDPARARLTAELVDRWMRLAWRTLADHPLNRQRQADGLEPANFILLKWVSLAPLEPLPRFETVTGMRGATVSSGRLFRGIARELELVHHELPSLADPAEDLGARLQEAERALHAGAEFVHVHTKAPDEAGHTKDPARKRDVISALDRAFEPLLSRAADENLLIVVTGDHGTPSGTGLIHSGDPVPLLAVHPSLRPDIVTDFGELSCTRGAFGHVLGQEFMPLMSNITGRTRYLGARLRPDAGTAWPGDYELFKLE